MNNKIEETTSYLRNAVAAQTNQNIKFKEDNYCYFSFEQLMKGRLDKNIYKNLIEKNKKGSIDVIIAAKTVKTIFESQERRKSDFADLTGIYFIPASLDSYGKLYYEEGKLPWIPREFLQPMIEEKIAVGNSDDCNNYISNNVGRINNIKSWQDYIEFAKDLYEYVTEEKFLNHKLEDVKLEKQVYIFKDNTINATFAIRELYDELIEDYKGSKLYQNFINLDFAKIQPLIKNELEEMKQHCGQMTGEFSLSSSQRECVNHFNQMEEGEILAVNGPPGTGKTTLVQSIVANMYVERALNKEKPPLIVATSTNNQAVTNIIESFSKIPSLKHKNLGERWIKGVNSLAVYFPSQMKEDNAEKKGYHYTNNFGKNFISKIEAESNLQRSKEKLLKHCSKYFNSELYNLNKCKQKIYRMLNKVDKARRGLLEIIDEVNNELNAYDIGDKTIIESLNYLSKEKKEAKDNIKTKKKRIVAWRNHFSELPLLYKLLKFIPPIKRKIRIKNRIFMKANEDFLDEDMSLTEIEEEYSLLIQDIKSNIQEMEKDYKTVEKLKKQYDETIKTLEELDIDIFSFEMDKYDLDLEKLNTVLDRKLRYIEFWLAIHYYECRWAQKEDALTENQQTSNYYDVMKQRYNRLSMVTPCYVMTFYQLPKSFEFYKGNEKYSYLYNYIDLLIVDEAGQVSPEIAACSFSLAKKALVVGDTHQIKPIWSINKSLDKALAKQYNVIEKEEEYKRLEKLGITTSNSSVMKVASKSCKYKKYGKRGLFLSEHRRCYNEIISFCNELVYGGKLEPKRGWGSSAEDYPLKNVPQIGYRQIDSKRSNKVGSSRYNKKEAKKIVNWVTENFTTIKKAYKKEENLIGIVTPFKEQARFIKKEIKKQLPKIHKYITVGTVHVFQGAEREIIIISLVYGKEDGCYFVDANSNLLNVAVSRAKDSFLVFGDINCLKSNRGKPSGLLKSFIKNNSFRSSVRRKIKRARQ